MKIFKLLAESIRLYKNVGKDIFETDKWNYTESALIEQLNSAKTIKNNVTQLAIFYLIITILFFFVNMAITNFVDSFIIFTSMWIITIIVQIFFLYIFKVISPSDNHIFLIKKYLMVNHLLKAEGNNGTKNIRVLKDSDTISKFIAHYELDNECHMVVLHYISNTLVLYFCSKSDIEIIKPGDIINKLIENNQITIDGYIQAIQTS